MTDQAKPGRPPANDLSAFDLSRRSPEQLAQSFARWKAQRKRRPEAMRASQPLHTPRSSVAAQDMASDALPSDEAVAPKQPPVKAAVRYSTPFSALLAAGSEPTVQRPAWTPLATRPSPKRNASSGRRLKTMTVLAGAASVLALGGGAALELSDWRVSTEMESEVVQIHPPEVPKAAPIAAAAMSAPVAEWTLQRTVDLALMKSAPAANAAPPVRPAPEPPEVQTASKAAPPSAASKPAPAQPIAERDAPMTAQFVAKPFVPTPTPAATPATQGTAATPAPPVTAVIRSGDPRPDAIFQHGRDQSTSGNGAVGNRVASGGKPAETAKSNAVDARTTTARSATAAAAGSGDPRGEGSGGARVGPSTGGEIGSATGEGDASGGADAGGGATGDDGTTGGGSASSAAGGGDIEGSATGSSDAGSGDTGGGNTGGSNTGGSNTGGDDTGDDAGSSAGNDGGSGDGESDSSDGGDGNSGGIGGAIGGALGGLGDALGGALGGGKSESED